MAEAIFALGGNRRSGKSLIADHLAKKYGVPRASFANGIRDCLTTAGVPLLKITDEKDIPFPHPISLTRDMYKTVSNWVDHHLKLQLPADPPNKLFMSGREMLIWLGEMVREMKPDAWTSYLFRGYPEGPLIIDDVRFQAQRWTISAMGGVLVLVRRWNKTEPCSSEAEIGQPHEYNFVIENAGTVDELLALADELWRVTMRKHGLVS